MATGNMIWWPASLVVTSEGKDEGEIGKRASVYVSVSQKAVNVCDIHPSLCPHRAHTHTFVVEVSAGCQPAGMDDFCKTFKCHLVQQRAFFFLKYR